jgi:hypothetical protein
VVRRDSKAIVDSKVGKVYKGSEVHRAIKVLLVYKAFVVYRVYVEFKVSKASLVLRDFKAACLVPKASVGSRVLGEFKVGRVHRVIRAIKAPKAGLVCKGCRVPKLRVIVRALMPMMQPVEQIFLAAGLMFLLIQNAKKLQLFHIRLHPPK